MRIRTTFFFFAHTLSQTCLFLLETESGPVGAKNLLVVTQLINIRARIQAQVHLTPKLILSPWCVPKGLPEVPRGDQEVVFLHSFVYALSLPGMTLTHCLPDKLYGISNPP